MKQSWKQALIVLLLMAKTASAQDAHSMAIGGATSAAPMGAFGLYWNPALLSLPDSATNPHVWTVASGYSAFDTSNTSTPILKLTDDTALQSGANPFKRLQQYTGLFVAKYMNMAGGVLWNQDLSQNASNGSMAFFHERDANNLSAGTTYSLNYQKTKRQIATLIVGYSNPLPLGSIPFLSIGGSLKYHDGIEYNNTSLTGTYNTAVTGGYNYTKTTASSGLGLSIDAGLFANLNQTLQAGLMLQNIQSNFNWTAQRQTIQLDSAGRETVASTQNLTLNANFPYATDFGLVIAPQDKNIVLEGDVIWVSKETRWKFGMERFYPENNLVIRLGTFNDDISNSQMWCFGIGYQSAKFTLDLSFVTRSLPAIQDAIAVGGAMDAAIRF